jgi:hypothetical protein
MGMMGGAQKTSCDIHMPSARLTSAPSICPFLTLSSVSFVSPPFPQTQTQSVLFSWDLMLSWKSHQSVFTTLLQDHYLRNTLGVKILPLDLLPTGKVVSQ